MSRKLIISGQREPIPPHLARGASAMDVPFEPVTDLLEGVEVVETFNLSRPARDRAGAPIEFTANDDDILEIEVEGGFKLWTSVARYSAEIGLLKPEAIDGGIRVDALPRMSVSERGIKEWFQSGLRILRLKDDVFGDLSLDPSKWAEEFFVELGLKQVTKSSAWLATKFVMWKIESKLGLSPGLYTWADATAKRSGSESKPKPAAFEDFDAEKPVLVFIHGTGSSTLGSFGAFLNTDAQGQLQGLRAFFGEHIYALEHRTMSQSPIENAIELVSALPRHANLYLVSHSRGGIVGDLVCLKSIDANRIARFKRELPELADADEHDRGNLERLAGLLGEKQLRLQRFVRCAAPARGTLLASENIDTFLSVLTNLIGLIPGLSGNPLFEVAKRITLQIAKNRTRPELIPGIEAMIPTSPLVAFLNASDEKASGSLGVVAGDIEGGGWLTRLGVFLTDHAIYEARDNDLVVNTDSMFNGARREKAYYVFDQGADVSHFNYFRNERTRAALLDFLARKPDEAPGIFNPIDEEKFEPVPMLRPIARSGVAQPIVLVLPGTMGSHLEAGNSRVWLSYAALVGGGLTELSNVAAKNVLPASLIGDYYLKLCNYLQDSHEVIPFAYDWRKSVRKAGELLAGEVEKALSRSTQPVRIIAHGMGGLVVRAMIAKRSDLWDRICEREGGRFVMLGTPNRGSYTTVEALLGLSTTIQQIALLDTLHSTHEIAEIFAGFPGVLELLPSADKFFKHATWKEYVSRCTTAAIPSEQLLSDAKTSMNDLAAGSPPKHADRVLYVAGSSPRTARNVEFVDGRLVVEATTEGDGRVTYQSGKLQGVLTWYMDAEHGDLACHEAAFPAILDLLERGTTTRLPTAPLSVARGGERIYRALPEPVLYPSEASLTAGLMGQKRAKPHRKRAKGGFRVSVMHGDLRYAKFPVVVGHYEGDTIVGAEAQIDRVLDGALSNRYALGLYPSEFGSVSIVLRRPTALQKALRLPHGAIVLGLGKWGDLSVAQLANLIRRAALHYVLQLDDCGCEPGEGATAAANAGLSVLLIGGSSTTNIATGDSVGAILRGIAQANRELAARSADEKRIAEIEIVELFAGTAIEAAHVVNRLAKLIGDELDVSIEAASLLRREREGRTRLISLSARRPWRRWEISAVRTGQSSQKRAIPAVLAERLRRAAVETKDQEVIAAVAELALRDTIGDTSPHREIRFLTLSDRARAEATIQQRQPELVERLIKDSITHTQFRKEEARVLFDLMIPSDLKDGLAQLDNVIFVVDEETAPYPWELMSAGAEPICVTKGFVRQLQTARYRPHIGARAGALAYVVGDPMVSPPYRQLPGAREEAKQVFDLLRPRFDVTFLPEHSNALNVLAGLYSKPYRVVHLAGHGQYEAPTRPGDKARSGMVLDNGVFLTAVEIGQMSQVPELVFLNCCHIGQTGPEVQGTPSSVEFNRLAASVSRELIEMGVRAVVAAGWAVRDDVAKVFAATFYEKMLGGETFGDALKEARRRTWDMDQNCNTCGAYQAYGDPDYRLDPSASEATTAAAQYVDPAEFIEAVITIQRAAKDASAPARSQARVVAQLDELVKACPVEWLGLTDVLMAVGFAYGELGQFERASQHLISALEGEGIENKTTFQAVEYLANYEVRLAEAGLKVAKDGKDREHARDEALKAVERLTRLLSIAQTGERYSLLGSAYKRLAMLYDSQGAVRRNLELAAENYRRAHERALERKGFDPYPVLNWLTISTILGAAPSDTETLLARCEAAARERFATGRNFFEAVAIPDAALLRALGSGVLATPLESAVTVDRLARLYLDTFRMASPSTRELDSALKHMEITASLVEKLGAKDPAGKSTGSVLRDLRAAVAGDAGQASSRGTEASAAVPRAKKRRSMKPKPPRRPSDGISG